MGRELKREKERANGRIWKEGKEGENDVIIIEYSFMENWFLSPSSRTLRKNCAIESNWVFSSIQQCWQWVSGAQLCFFKWLRELRASLKCALFDFWLVFWALFCLNFGNHKSTKFRIRELNVEIYFLVSPCKALWRSNEGEEECSYEAHWKWKREDYCFRQDLFLSCLLTRK